MRRSPTSTCSCTACIREAAAIDAVLAAHIDRKAELLSPIEHAALMIGTFELMHCIEIPYKVAINEAVELAKSFGGTDGHKYVNGVLDKAAAELRRIEVERGPRGARLTRRDRSSASLWRRSGRGVTGARSLVSLCYERRRASVFHGSPRVGVT